MIKNVIVTLILIAILGLAISYIIRQKKKGVKCIGCPSGGCCPSKNGKTTQCTCGCQDTENNL